MPWATIEKSEKKALLGVGIHVAVTSVGRSSHAALHLTWVGVPEWCVSPAGINVEIGTGEHAGFLRLSKGGRYKGAYNEPKSGALPRLRLIVGGVAGIPAESRLGVPCYFEVGPNSVVVTLPKWDAAGSVTEKPHQAAPAKLADIVKPPAPPIAPVEPRQPAKPPAVPPAARAAVSSIAIANGRPQVVSTEQAVRWGAERGIPGPKLNLAQVNAKRRDLGLSQFVIEG